MTTHTQHDSPQHSGKSNHASDPKKASEAGKKGGEHSNSKSDSGRDSQQDSQEKTTVASIPGRSSGNKSAQSPRK